MNEGDSILWYWVILIEIKIYWWFIRISHSVNVCKYWHTFYQQLLWTVVSFVGDYKGVQVIDEKLTLLTILIKINMFWWTRRIIDWWYSWLIIDTHSLTITYRIVFSNFVENYQHYFNHEWLSQKNYSSYFSFWWSTNI